MAPRPLTVLAGLALSLQACGHKIDLDTGRGGEPRTLVLSPATALAGSAETLVAKPSVISEDAAGRIVITDLSDRNIKVYDASGRPVRVLGRAGPGPGEFTALTSAQVYRDSVLAYDVIGARVTTFAPDGRFAGSRPLRAAGRPAPFSIRIVDDSLFLLVSAISPASTRGMLTLVRPDGSIRSRFLDLEGYLGNNPQVSSAVGLLADGADGRIFATVAGGDSIWVFGYDGRRLGAFLADPVRPLVTARSLIDANRGRIRRANGGYVVDGNRMALAMVAMDSGTVAVQIAPYDGRLGVDPEEGGTFVVSSLAGSRGRMLARREITGFLLGRDRRDRLLILRYTSPEAEAHELVRAALVVAPGPR